MNFFKGLLLFVAGVITTLFTLFIIAMADTTESMTPQEQRYAACLDSVYQGYGENKITLDSDRASAEDRLSMKKYCLCVSNVERAEKLLNKKLGNFAKKHNGAEPSAAEYDVLLAEVESEMNTICNQESR